MATAHKAVSSGPTVDLLDLEVIRSFSIALRQATAPRAELIALLRADLARLEADSGAEPARRRGRPPKSTALAATPPVSRPTTKARPTPARSARRG